MSLPSILSRDNGNPSVPSVLDRSAAVTRSTSNLRAMDWATRVMAVNGLVCFLVHPQAISGSFS